MSGPVQLGIYRQDLHTVVARTSQELEPRKGVPRHFAGRLLHHDLARSRRRSASNIARWSQFLPRPWPREWQHSPFITVSAYNLESLQSPVKPSEPVCIHARLLPSNHEAVGQQHQRVEVHRRLAPFVLHIRDLEFGFGHDVRFVRTPTVYGIQGLVRKKRRRCTTGCNRITVRHCASAHEWAETLTQKGAKATEGATYTNARDKQLVRMGPRVCTTRSPLSKRCSSVRPRVAQRNRLRQNLWHARQIRRTQQPNNTKNLRPLSPLLHSFRTLEPTLTSTTLRPFRLHSGECTV